jgi:hypothetical protein
MQIANCHNVAAQPGQSNNFTGYVRPQMTFDMVMLINVFKHVQYFHTEKLTTLKTQ